MTHRSLIMELRGRLGNQLFQFALGYATAKRVDAPLFLSTEHIPPADLLLPQIVGPPAYQNARRSDLVRLGAQQYSGSDSAVLAALQGLTRHAARAAHHAIHRAPPILVELDEETTRVEERFLAPKLPCVLRGYFQSEGYFAEYATDINSAITLPNAADFLPADLPRPLIAVSFRRGDYNSLGWALPIDYYRTALTQLLERTSPGTLVLTGDDLAFLELVVPLVSPFARQVVNATEFAVDAISQLAILASCDHSIVANSSFSWWGAWLAEHRSSASPHLVFSPSGWIGGDECAPARWVSVEWDA